MSQFPQQVWDGSWPSGPDTGTIDAPTKADLQFLVREMVAIERAVVDTAQLGTAADIILYTTGPSTWAEASLTPAGRALLDDATAANQRTTLELGTASNVSFGTVSLLSASFPVIAARRSGAATSGTWASSYYCYNTSGTSISDGFGSIILCGFRKSGVDNYSAYFGAVRDGADNSGAFIIGSYSGGSASEIMRASASKNVGIGTTSFPASCVRCLTLGDGTAPSGALANTATIVSVSGELWAYDSAGNGTQQTPHALDAPPDIYILPPGYEEIDISANEYTGRLRWENRDTHLVIYEDAATYNTRTGRMPGDTGYKQAKGKTGWDADEQATLDRRQREQADWDTGKADTEHAQAEWDVLSESIQRGELSADIGCRPVQIGDRPPDHMIRFYPFADIDEKAAEAACKKQAMALLAADSPMGRILRALMNATNLKDKDIEALINVSDPP